jgi:class 3 adenylate cyclase
MNCPACETKNPERAKYCLECGQRLPASRTVSSPDRTGFRRRVRSDKHLPREEGERRRAVVLCAEVAVPAGEGGDPADLRDRVADLFRRFEAVVVRTGGAIDRFHGDAMTATFGLPEAREDDAARAVRCALDLRGAVAE